MRIPLLASNFYFFAGLNLLGAVLVYFTIEKTPCMKCIGAPTGSHFSAWIIHLKNPSLRASFAIDFCILFAFIGTFTYVNFVLVQPPLGVGAMTLGFVCFVFLPAMAITPLAGLAVSRFGTRPTFWAALLVAALGLPLLILPKLPVVLLRMVLVGVGTFFAQACRDLGSRLGERPLSRLLFLRRPDRKRRARGDLRHVRLDGLRRRRCRIAVGRGPARRVPQDPMTPELVRH